MDGMGYLTKDKPTYFVSGHFRGRFLEYLGVFSTNHQWERQLFGVYIYLPAKSQLTNYFQSRASMIGHDYVIGHESTKQTNVGSASDA